MKIIHTADLHIGSAFADLSGDAKKQRKAELVNAFKRLVEYAKTNSISIIILAGDVFDKDKVNKSDKDLFYQIIEANQEIQFLYLKGNHDIHSLENKEDIPNLYLFDKSWKYYEFDNVCIAGIELSSENANTLYSTLSLKDSKYNIVMLHGQVTSSVTNPSNDILINKLRNKNVDYVALGHIHTYATKELDSRGIYVYPGCLEGRGFDEVGDKGFVVLDTTTKSHQFIPFATRKVYEVVVDLTATNSLYEAIQLVEDQMNQIPNKAIARTVLTGKVNYDLTTINDRLITSLESHFLYYEVKNKTTKLVQLEDYEHDISLKGEVIRTILSKNLEERQQSAILEDCMKLLNGEDIDL